MKQSRLLVKNADKENSPEFITDEKIVDNSRIIFYIIIFISMAYIAGQIRHKHLFSGIVCTSMQ